MTLIDSLPPLANKTTLLKQCGWTPGLITLLLGKPDLEKRKAKGSYRWVEHLYKRDRVVEAMRDPRFVARVEARQQRAEALIQRKAQIPQQYQGNWRDALPEACAGMFSLNRYAKHRKCSDLHKVEIYRLKNELIDSLYRHGYCSASWIHRLPREAKLCPWCGGAGDLDCGRCGGSGIAQRAIVFEFWCFQFEVAGRPFCWHQPLELVKFSPLQSVPPQEWQEYEVKEKPVPLRKDQFARAKELLEWVIKQSGGEQQQPVYEEVGQRGAVGPFELWRLMDKVAA